MAVFIKQYGEKRTGTNLLRALIETHYADVHVLIHALGDKHSPPVPFAQIFGQVQDSGAAIGEFTVRSTLASPALTTLRDDPDQNAFLSCLGTSIAESYEHGTLLFLISIKHPYSWYASIRRFARLDEASPAPAVRHACRRFNRHYRAWFALKAEVGDRAVAVRYEDVLTDPGSASANAAARFGLSRRTAGPITLPSELIVPTYWDHQATSAAKGFRFDGSVYRADAYLSELSAEDLRIMTELIDWEQLAEFGYEPLARP